MSTIRYTFGGDYDPKNSAKLDISDAGSPLFVVRPYLDDEFYIVGRRDDMIVFQFRHTVDGLYANFSDSTRPASMTGGDVGDVLIGGASDDSLSGGSGDDVLIGGAGRDKLTGGTGADTFAFWSLEDFSGKPERILDFSGSNEQKDKIDLTRIANFTFIGEDQFHGNEVAELRARSVKSGFYLYGDTDGDGVSDFQFKVVTDSPLTEADFVRAAAGAVEPVSVGIDVGLFTHPAFADHPLGLSHLALA